MQLVPQYTGAKGTAIALGFFDGVHNGHRAVISAACHAAAKYGWEPAVFTFSLPPEADGMGRKGLRLCTPEQKYGLLETLRVEYCFEPPFGEISALAPDVFFTSLLLDKYKAKALFCGDDFAFGANRTGNIHTLRALCDVHGIQLTVVPTALWQGEEVSSSRIRAALAKGDIEAANAMLGRPYEVCLPVRHGQGLGKTLGFPTLNQQLPAWMQPPKEGVYITQTEISGRLWPSATGYGARPTVNGEELTCETFIPGFSGDLYGKVIPVRFFSRIADTTRFSGKQQLAGAVQRWAIEAQDYFEKQAK